MRFRSSTATVRTVEEQRYILAMMAVWRQLPIERREKIRELIGSVSETPIEGRALFDLLIQRADPERVHERTGVSVYRLRQMRNDFMDGFTMW